MFFGPRTLPCSAYDMDISEVEAFIDVPTHDADIWDELNDWEDYDDDDLFNDNEKLLD